MLGYDFRLLSQNGKNEYEEDFYCSNNYSDDCSIAGSWFIYKLKEKRAEYGFKS